MPVKRTFKAALPERLKKRLLAEAIIEYDRNFPIYKARIDQIEYHIDTIVAHLLFLLEDLEALPEHIRTRIVRIISGEDSDIVSKIEDLRENGAALTATWLDLATKLAEQKINWAASRFAELNYYWEEGE